MGNINNINIYLLHVLEGNKTYHTTTINHEKTKKQYSTQAI